MKRVEQLWEKDEIYKQLREIASRRGITLGELIRTVIIPEWLGNQKNSWVNAERALPIF
jgi:predicted DNA-binding ribbon-helix-helix protein